MEGIFADNWKVWRLRKTLFNLTALSMVEENRIQQQIKAKSENFTLLIIAKNSFCKMRHSVGRASFKGPNLVQLH